MSDATRSEGQPQDRLTRICDAMTDTMQAHPEFKPGDKCCIFIDSDADKRGGLVLAGYEDDGDALANLFEHLAAIFEANGSKLEIVPLPTRGHG